MRISPNDSNSYRYITLPNKVRLLLISDESAQKSAAAVAIRVGHFDDPIERQGLAHFLEHMLFLGTRKYPKEGEFQNFINQHGGSHNAWTGTEHSAFFFDITPNVFEQALDRFSQFFTDPLFNEDALDKERQAVESEYKLKVKDDTRRLYQVHKETINQAHPFAKFSVGNLDTLSDINGVSIRDEIVDFHQQNYSADLMTVSIMGPQSLDTLESWATVRFAKIANQHLADKAITVPLVTPEHTKTFNHVCPIKELRKLVFSFPMPGMEQHYRSKPLSYFAHLLGYEGKGSFMIALKDKGWINSLSAGGGIHGSNYREFTIGMQLTKEGLKHVDEITQILFHYINIIKRDGIAEWRYLEKRAVLESAFRYQEVSRPLDVVSHLVINMQHYAEDDIIYGDYMMDGYDEALLRKVTEYFTVANLRTTLLAKGGKYEKQANWYHTPYSVRRYSDQQAAYFSSPPQDITLELPPANPFICYDLDAKIIESVIETPEIIKELAGFRLWHMQDTEYRVPKGVIYVAIDSPHSVANDRNIVMTRLCVEMFLDSLAKETYQAEIAGMGYNMYAHQGGVTLSISGFSQKQAELLAMILQRFALREFSERRFEAIKQQLKRNWQNAAQDRPISQLFNALTGLLQPNNPPYETLLTALETIKVEELSSFVELIMAELHIEMFVYGDWHKQDALMLGETLINALHFHNQQYEESLRPLVMLGKNGTFQHEHHCNQDDSAVVLYYQCEDTTPRNIALYSLSNHLMSATFFNEIRTKQQLGYMVGTGNMPLNRHPGLALYVQSPNAAPVDLVGSIDEFLNAFYLILLELSEYEWHSSKRGLWNQIAAPDPSLRSRAQRFWVAIGNKDTEFNQREKVLDELKSLKRSDMIRFVVNELKPRTANRLIMHTRGNVHKDDADLNLGQEIGSIEAFQLRPKAYDIG